jgi:hypothetical protein
MMVGRVGIRWVWMAMVGCALAALPEAAQQRPTLPTGTGSISGRVIAGDTGKPIRNASVEIVIYGNLSGRFAQAVTDGDGKFVFPNLPAGHFQLAAQAAGYIRMQFGQLAPGALGLSNPARAIDLAEGQAFTPADFTLQHFNAIEGVVTDEFGDPAPNVMVQASQVQFVGGRRRLLPINPNLDAGPARPTDDTGHFRIAGLAPGDYYVEALTGAFADPNAAGGFAPTYFPGTADSTTAHRVTLAPGRDATDVSFALVPAPSLPVAGTLIDASGQPLAKGTVMLMSAEGAGPLLFLIMRAPGGPDGQFAFRNVPPGAYTIQAFGPPLSGASGIISNGAFGYLTLRVGPDVDSSHVTVHVPAPRTLRGHITFEPDPTVPLPAPSAVRVDARPVEFESAPVGGGPSPTTVHDDWTFDVRAMSGRRVILSEAPGWILKSIRLDGQDVTDVPLDLREHDVNDVEVVLTTHATTVTATLTVPKERAVSDYTLLVFAADDTKWTLWSRYVALVRPNSRGVFAFRGLPPGSYQAVVVGTVSGGEWQDPEYLRALLTGGEGVPFLLGDGETKTLALTARR